ncbi:MAG: hypothetical protein WDO19_06475 [Bacteroidota bacterium]
MKDFSYITSSSPAFIESLYQEFSKNPDNVEPEFRKFFEGFDFAFTQGNVNGNGHANGTAVKERKTEITEPSISADGIDWRKELGAYRMILGYRNKGHLIAKTNPIRERKDRDANLNLKFFGLSEEDYDKTFQVGERIGIGSNNYKKYTGPS